MKSIIINIWHTFYLNRSIIKCVFKGKVKNLFFKVLFKTKTNKYIIVYIFVITSKKKNDWKLYTLWSKYVFIF